MSVGEYTIHTSIAFAFVISHHECYIIIIVTNACIKVLLPNLLFSLLINVLIL